MMAAATTSLKVMNGLKQAQASIKWNRIERDENGLHDIIQCIDTKLINPFDISQYKGEKMPLINIAIRTVAPSKVSEPLLAR